MKRWRDIDGFQIEWPYELQPFAAFELFASLMIIPVVIFQRPCRRNKPIYV